MGKFTPLAQICKTVQEATEKGHLHQTATEIADVIDKAERGEMDEAQIRRAFNRIAIEANDQMCTSILGNPAQSWHFAFFMAEFLAYIFNKKVIIGQPGTDFKTPFSEEQQ